MNMNIKVVGTLNQLSTVPEVQVFFGDGGGGGTRIKSVLSLVVVDCCLLM